MPFLEQRRLQLAVVLDDAVEDEVDVAIDAARQRMGVLGADAAVCTQRVWPTPVVAWDVLSAAASSSSRVTHGADLGELPVLDECEARRS